MGATAEEQAIWHALAGNPTPLPMLFREALFRPPRAGAGPVLILRTPAERDRAVGGGYAQDRRELERRLRARFPAYARAAPAGTGRVHYATYDECMAGRARDEGG